MLLFFLFWALERPAILMGSLVLKDWPADVKLPISRCNGRRTGGEISNVFSCRVEEEATQLVSGGRMLLLLYEGS
jgi:hypothetical protein